MPEPVRGDQRYVAALDGMRALAVAAVILYHLQVGWASGGLLGVGVFFTLSGYLITDLLLGQWQRVGGLALRDFWARRARRLLPALFVLLLVVVGWVSLFDHAQLRALRGNVAAAAAYVSNWWSIAHHTSYFAALAPPSPLDHLWSLAVEEQFYLVWPLLLLVGLRFWSGRGRLPAATLALAALSAGAMALLYHPGVDPTRVYDGTDTRAFELLIGAALAMVWPSRSTGRPALPGLVGRRWFLDGAGAAGLLAATFLVWRSNQFSTFLYPTGLLLLSLATALVIAAVVQPGSRLGAALGCLPLRWLGVRSYGIYLWHFPVIVLTSPAHPGGLDLPRAAGQTAASVALAALSWRFVEEPVRHGALGRLWRRAVATARVGLAGRRPTELTGAVTLPALACVGVAAVVAAVVRIPPAAPATDLPARLSDGPATSLTIRGGWPAGADPGPRALLPAVPPPAATRTSCRAVAHIGDSTSEGLVSPDYLPDPGQRITARYAAVGVVDQYIEIAGARSTVETWHGQPNAHQVAEQLVAAGYRGCWVLALGTNDTANVYVGSAVGRLARIARMMSVIGDQPVLWVDVKSLVASGPYSETNMRLWNDALLAACQRYPNLRVFDWAAVVRDRWFISDGIHYTSAGYAARAQLIAQALVRAFPADGPPVAGCLVR